MFGTVLIIHTIFRCLYSYIVENYIEKSCVFCIIHSRKQKVILILISNEVSRVWKGSWYILYSVNYIYRPVPSGILLKRWMTSCKVHTCTSFCKRNTVLMPHFNLNLTNLKSGRLLFYILNFVLQDDCRRM